VRIAFIVQRYGTEILGGSEYHCRLIAERMAARHQVDVLTTCARDYVTWKNEYPEGHDRVRGVTVRRFASAEVRDITAFNRYSDWIFNYEHTRDDEMQWLRRQGPWCPALVEHLEKSHQNYDVLVFFTYLYAPTVLGLQIAPSKSVLVPTAHDEPAIRLGIYREMFARPAGIAYNTDVERRFLTSEFAIRAVAEETVGCGVELPWDEDAHGEGAGHRRDRSGEVSDADGRPHRDDRRRRRDRREPQESEPPPADDHESGRFRTLPPGTQFRRRHRLYGPLALFGGRIDRGKGCEELFEYFGAFVRDGSEATLALMGVKLMPIPEVPWVRFAGMLPEQERLQALEAATVVVVPSPFESLSLLALEAFAVGTPVVANGRSEVLVAHCRQGNAGLYYEDRDEFVEAMKLLMADQRLRQALGRNGREYVRTHYRWDVILAKYERLFARMRDRRQG
jgi:glycosyltransferase involved in cell wall biosynthesis